MNMHNPPHPGSILREDVLPAMELNVTEAAKALHCSRAALSRIINERASISPAMALRIESWLGVEHGGRADIWAGLQLDYDLWRERKKNAA